MNNQESIGSKKNIGVRSYVDTCVIKNWIPGHARYDEGVICG